MKTERSKSSASTSNLEVKQDAPQNTRTPNQNSLTTPTGALDVEFQLQHAGETRNPYPDLLAILKKTMLIHIHAFGTEEKSEHGERRNSLITPSGYIPSTKSMIPPLFSLAAAQVCQELGLPSISMRTTAASIFTLPHAPKPSSAKYKTGKGGVSDSIIPYDDDTITLRNADGRLQHLIQNEKYKPKLGRGIELTHYAIPFEKIVLGLTGRLPEFSILNENEVKKSGILEFRMNSEDTKIKNLIFRIDLKESDIVKPVKNQIHVISTASKPKMKPEWWDDSFDDYKKMHKCGYHVNYKKENTTEFNPYQAYARLNKDGILAVITGDQDLFSMPRSMKYNLGVLTTHAIDTQYEAENKYDVDGDRLLAEKLTELNDLIIREKSIEMREQGKSEDEISHYRKNTIDNIEQFINSFNPYIKRLGTITPFEAYTIISINLRENELREKIRLNPGCLDLEIPKVSMTASIGLTEIIKKKLDVDLHPAWFESNQDPENCIIHIESQLQLSRYISNDILFIYMNKKEEIDHDKLVSLYRMNDPSESKSIHESKIPTLVTKGLSLNHEKLNHLSWEIYSKNQEDSIKLIKTPQDWPIDIAEILILVTENQRKGIIHFKENQVYSTPEIGTNSINKVLEIASTEIGSSCIIWPEENDTPAIANRNMTFK